MLKKREAKGHRKLACLSAQKYRANVNTPGFVDAYAMWRLSSCFVFDNSLLYTGASNFFLPQSTEGVVLCSVYFFASRIAHKIVLISTFFPRWWASCLKLNPCLIFCSLTFMVILIRGKYGWHLLGHGILISTMNLAACCQTCQSKCIVKDATTVLYIRHGVC